ncbi:MAG: hypothetical protein VW453_04270 [Rhodospirillaceae bacterium]
MLDSYRNARLREELLKDAKKAAAKGSLNDLVRIVDNAKKRKWDERNFQVATRRHAALSAEIAKLQTDEKRLQRQAMLLGRQISANIACVLSVLVIAVLVFSRIG